MSTHELELLRRASASDPVAITVLLAHSHSHLRARIQHRIPPEFRAAIDPDDIIQETQVDVYRHSARFEPRGVDSFDRWVATIALRKLRNALKAARTLKRGQGRARVPLASTNLEASTVALLELISAEKTPSRNAAQHEAALALEAALAQLPEPYQQAVRLIYIEGRSVADAAAAMGRTPRAIHNLCHKAKERLRASMGSRSRFLSRS